MRFKEARAFRQFCALSAEIVPMMMPTFDMEKRIEKIRGSENYVNSEMLADMEQALIEAKEAAGLAQKRNPLFRFIDKKVAEWKPKTFSKKRYVTLLLTCGWICGAHCFYAGKKIKGVLYLLLSWTGISFAMSLIDWMQVVPMKADENGNIAL